MSASVFLKLFSLTLYLLSEFGLLFFRLHQDVSELFDLFLIFILLKHRSLDFTKALLLFLDVLGNLEAD